MEVVNHKLQGDKVVWVEATSYGKNITIVPDTIVIHYTAGPSGPATVRLFSAKDAKLSAHLVAGEDGTMTQMVPFDKKGYHAGTSEYAGRSNFNGFSIGIEISNPGYLTKNPKGDGYLTWWEANKATGTPYPADKVFEGKHRNAVTTNKFWAKYPDEQIEAVKQTCAAICKAYKIKYILGHEEIAPGRKSDPGPAFPLDELRNELLGTTATTTTTTPVAPIKDVIVPAGVIKTGTITAAKLNLRAAADPNGAIISVLPKGEVVNIVKEEGDWYKVLFKVKGWVKRDAVAQDNDDTDPEDVEVVGDTLVIKADAKDSAAAIANTFKKGDKLYSHTHLDNYISVTGFIPGYLAKKFVS